MYLDERGELSRVPDGQRPIKDVIASDLRYISWDSAGNLPSQLRLRQYPDIAPVIIDPRFGWGSPVVEINRVPVDAVADLWLAGSRSTPWLMSTTWTTSRSRQSAVPTRQPEFFLDRGLGRRVAEELAALGWLVHRIVDHFPNDAQWVSDDGWLEYGLEHGWIPLCEDGRIRGRDHERRPIEVHCGVLFYLDNQRLVTAEMVRRFHQAQHTICQRIPDGGPAIYAVGADDVYRTWPRRRRRS